MTRIRAVVIACLALVAVGLASCAKSDGRKPTFPVSGKVLLSDGKPAEHAIVVFHPVGETGPEVVKPRGKVGRDGTYTLTTYDGNDGAPAGDYKVTVELWLSTGNGDEGPKSRLAPKYANPEKSGLSAAVSAGSTEIKLIELKR